jgi:hypothetical protein
MSNLVFLYYPTLDINISSLAMAITELIFPCVKPDPATLEALERDWPKLSKGLTVPNPGIIDAFRGWIVTEDGLDVRNAYREILLFGKFARCVNLSVSDLA